MSEPVRPRGVVMAHAGMAEGLVSAVRRIAGGAADRLTPISNDGKGPEALRDELDALAGDEPVVVFVDLRTGSCGMAALQCCRDRARRVLVGGVNLPMLLDFVLSDEEPIEALADRLVDRGRAAIDRPRPKR